MVIYDFEHTIVYMNPVAICNNDKFIGYFEKPRLEKIMFDFLKPKTHGELDGIITRLEANKANNYKDNAQANFKELQDRYQTLLENGKLNDKQIKHYEDIIYSYGLTLKGYTHKDQTPYWK